MSWANGKSLADTPGILVPNFGRPPREYRRMSLHEMDPVPSLFDPILFVLPINDTGNVLPLYSPRQTDIAH